MHTPTPQNYYNTYMNTQPIGVFDSGFGGLTILKALRKKLPHERFIYFGDSANVPYGGKSKQAVTRLSLAIARFLQEQHVKLIVVACNTASSLALNALQKQSKVPVIGVIEAGAQYACKITENGRIAVLGTEGTIKSKAYTKAILKRNPGARIFGQACGLFAPLVEEGWANTEPARLIAQRYLSPVQKFGADTIILGCTHYPVLKNTIASVIGKQVKLVDSAQTLAQAVDEFLRRNNQAALHGKGSVCFYASDDPARFAQGAKKILHEPIKSVRLKKLSYEDF